VHYDYMVSQSHFLYFAYAVHPGAWSLHPTCCPVVLALLRLCRAFSHMVSPPDLLSGRTGSTSPMLFVWSHGLSARLVVRSHWLYFVYAVRVGIS
jgi:hypothetical protein